MLKFEDIEEQVDLRNTDKVKLGAVSKFLICLSIEAVTSVAMVIFKLIAACGRFFVDSCILASRIKNWIFKTK